MELLRAFLSFFLHIDTHLESIIQTYGIWTYGILFGIVLAETGFVVTPFLPGDSLLFAAGAFAGKGALHPFLLWALLSVAAILGDTINFSVGHRLGEAVYSANSRWIKREHLEKTHAFFVKYGAKAVVIARFMPIIRTFAPFVAGVGRMPLATFVSYNVIGGLLWVSLFVGGGYYFGSLPFVEKNFSLVILVIIILSVLPPVYEWWRARRRSSVAMGVRAA